MIFRCGLTKFTNIAEFTKNHLSDILGLKKFYENYKNS